MAGLLGNIATATGNNMAQYAHTKQRQDFQAEQQQAQRDHISQLEQWRAERQERLALRAREWQVEDRDKGLQAQGLLAEANGQREQFGQQVEFARTDLNQINEEVSKLRSAIHSYDPMADADGTGKSRLQDELSRLESRRAMIMEAIPDEVLRAAGPLANATHRELLELSQQLQSPSTSTGAGLDGEGTGELPPEPQSNGSINSAFNDDWRAQQEYHNSRRADATDFWKRVFTERAPGSEYRGSRGNF